MPTPRRLPRSVLPCLLAWGSAWACAADPAAGRPAITAGRSTPGPIEVAPELAVQTPSADAGVTTDGGVHAPDAPDGQDGQDARTAADAGPGTQALEPTEPPPPLINPVPVEDPSGVALRGFHAALARAASGEGQARIAFFGASHVASDLFTDVIRSRLQARFGDAGPGFLPVAKPWRWHRHGRIEYLRSRAFTGARVKARAPQQDRYGLMGVAMENLSKRGIAGLRVRATDNPADGVVDHLELYYLRQPGGGQLRVLINGEQIKTIKTNAVKTSAGYERFDFPPGTPELELRTLANGPVRIFGVVAERSAPGVVLDTLGIPGSRARYHLYWEDALYREHLARRRPDLVVLAYGTNESGDDDVPITTYEKRLRKVLRRIKEVTPGASCLLIGPSDRPIRLDDESYGPRPRTAELVQAQRKLSAEFSCGFFDLVGFMGGPMSMTRWVTADPQLGAPDHVHYTRRGYEALGEHLHESLMQGYEAAVAADVADAAPTASGAPRRP